MCLQFGFVIYWQKDFGAKAAHKMLVKLTLGYYYMEGIVAVKSFMINMLSSSVCYSYFQPDHIFVATPL
jgi:hypothetical protein